MANSITALRIILAPISVLFLFWDIPHKDLIAASFFIMAGMTDGLDGWAARVRKQTTQFGKSFDPFADKVLITSALFSLAKLDRVMWWMFWVIIAREAVVTVLRQLASRRSQAIGASKLGKAKTASQMVSVAAIILWPKVSWPQYCLWAALLLSVISGLDYLFRWRVVFQHPAESSSVSG